MKKKPNAADGDRVCALGCSSNDDCPDGTCTPGKFCPPGEDGPGTTTGSPDGPGTDGTTDGTTDGGTDSGTTGGGAGGWEEVGGAPCSANALWFDDRNNGFLGCGDKANNGWGLWVTSDGGKSWEIESKFGNSDNCARINEIVRGPDGVLYAAGNCPLEGASAMSITEGGTKLSPVGLYEYGNKAFTAVAQAENIAVAADGQKMTDSLTGVQVAWTPGPGVSLPAECDGSDGSDWNPSGDWCELYSTNESTIGGVEASSGWGFRDIVAWNNKFYATGNTISDPASVYLPSKDPAATYHHTKVELQGSNYDGEPIAIHVWSDTHILVAGVNWTLDVPLIYLCDGDCYDKSGWTEILLDEMAQPLDLSGRIWGISVDGDHVVAVGEKFPSSKGGFIIESKDGGQTWTDISPYDEQSSEIATMESVKLFSNGDIYAVGDSAYVYTD